MPPRSDPGHPRGGRPPSGSGRSVLVTGSTQGIGLEIARTLVSLGHRVVGHARTRERARTLEEALPAVPVVVGDLASLEETRSVAEQARTRGPYDAVIHNAGVGGGASRRETTRDGLERIFQVNVLAPYVLTALMDRPARLVYLTSGLEARGHIDLDDLQRAARPWDGMAAYSDSKLGDVVLTFLVARRWPGVISNAVDPGWIRTRMGGPGAPDPLHLGAETPVWLAISDDPTATRSGRYLKRRRELRANAEAYQEPLREGLMAVLAELSGVSLPA